MTQESQNEISAEVLRTQQIDTFARKSGDLWEYISMLKEDLAQTYGKTEFQIPDVPSAHVSEIGEAAGITPATQLRWLAGLIYPDDSAESTWREDADPSSVKLYFDYFQGLGLQDSKQLETKVKSALTKHPQLFGFLNKLNDTNPLIGTATTLLYAQAAEAAEGDTETRKLQWFKESIESAGQTDREIAETFGKLKDRNSKLPPDPAFDSFIQAWEDDMRLNIAEVTNVASCMAIRMQEPDSYAILSSSVQVGTKYDQFAMSVARIHELEGPEKHPDGRTPLFRKYSQKIFDYLDGRSPRSGELVVPCITSFVDLPLFFNFYQRFWKQVNSGIRTEGKYSVDNPQASDGHFIRLGNAATLMIREQPRPGAQARISLLGEASFRGFGLRVDQENDQLALDIGDLNLDQALSYAHLLAQEDESADFLQSFPDITDAKGKIKSRRSFYPSIMGAEGSVDPWLGAATRLTDGNRAALFLSLAMREGHTVGLRQGKKFFSYHSREELAKQDRDQFPARAKRLKQILTTVA